MEVNLTDNVAVVTGGGQGIGRAVAFAFAKEGYQVAILDIDAEAGEETCAIIARTGGTTLAFKCDVALESEVIDTVSRITESFGRIDILINNAGIGIGGSLETLTLEDWNRVIGVNLTGTFLMSKYCLPYLKASESGCIVNISSTRALMSEPDTFPYSASKGGILALTHSLAVSLGPYGIRANSICPGWIEVGDWKKVSKRSAPEHSREDREQHPVGRVGVPEDIAQACVFLCSPGAGFVTGANLVVDGGMTVKMIYV